MSAWLERFSPEGCIEGAFLTSTIHRSGMTPFTAALGFWPRNELGFDSLRSSRRYDL